MFVDQTTVGLEPIKRILQILHEDPMAIIIEKFQQLENEILGRIAEMQFVQGSWNMKNKIITPLISEYLELNEDLEEFINSVMRYLKNCQCELDVLEKHNLINTCRILKVLFSISRRKLEAQKGDVLSDKFTHKQLDRILRRLLARYNSAFYQMHEILNSELYNRTKNKTHYLILNHINMQFCHTSDEILIITSDEIKNSWKIIHNDLTIDGDEILQNICEKTIFFDYNPIGNTIYHLHTTENLNNINMICLNHEIFIFYKNQQIIDPNHNQWDSDDKKNLDMVFSNSPYENKYNVFLNENKEDFANTIFWKLITSIEYIINEHEEAITEENFEYNNLKSTFNEARVTYINLHNYYGDKFHSLEDLQLEFIKYIQNIKFFCTSNIGPEIIKAIIAKSFEKNMMFHDSEKM